MRLVLAGILLTTSPYALCKDTFLVDEEGGKFTLHINGYAYHFKRSGHNEKNYGAGLSYHHGQIKSENELLNESRVAFELDIFRDSFSDIGYAAGVTWQKQLFNSLDWGLKLGFVHEDHLWDTEDMYLVPYLLPFVESRWKTPVNVRMTLTPPLGDLSNGMVFFQMIVGLDKP